MLCLLKCALFLVCYGTSENCGVDGDLDRLDFMTQSDCCLNGGESFSDGMGACVACPPGMVIYCNYNAH